MSKLSLLTLDVTCLWVDPGNGILDTLGIAQDSFQEDEMPFIYKHLFDFIHFTYMVVNKVYMVCAVLC